VAPDFRKRATPCFIGVFSKIEARRRINGLLVPAVQREEGQIVVKIQKIANEIRGWRGFG
jgi:hypothetical protein